MLGFVASKANRAGMAVWFVAGLIGDNLSAHEARSPNVQIVSSIHPGGLLQRSPSYEVAGFVGYPGSVVTSTSGSYLVREGPVGMVVYPDNFVVESASAEINESGTTPEDSTHTQLSGKIVNDDDTVDPVTGAEIAWLPPAVGAALTSISPDGIASAGAVYEDTPASFSGSFAGWSDTGTLLVHNILDDNFGPLAGNTFDDAWEMANGQTQGFDTQGTTQGLPNWAFYAMDLDPRNPLGELFPAATDEGFLAISYRRNPRATEYRFVVEEAQNLTTGFVELINPVSEVHTTADGAEIVTVRGSVPVESADHQFMRVRVEKASPGEPPGPTP